MFLFPVLKHKVNSRQNEYKSNQVIPFKFFFKIEYCESDKHHKRDDFLYGFKLKGAELAIADSIGRHLEAIFEKCDAPANQNYLP